MKTRFQLCKGSPCTIHRVHWHHQAEVCHNGQAWMGMHDGSCKIPTLESFTHRTESDTGLRSCGCGNGRRGRRCCRTAAQKRTFVYARSFYARTDAKVISNIHIIPMPAPEIVGCCTIIAQALVHNTSGSDNQYYLSGRQRPR